jgi:S-DNA-T family DNA segregation ATPase FtsK/SpoIIIE
MSSFTGQDRQRLLPPSLEVRLIGTFGRGCGIALLAALGALWLALVSWSVADPSLSHATGGAIRNALGGPGAIVADLLLQTLGLAAAAALLPPMIWGLELVFSQRLDAPRAKAIYLPLALIGIAGAAAAISPAASWPIEHGYGGIVGDIVFNFASSLASLVGGDRANAAACVLLAGLGLSSMGRTLGLSRNALAFERPFARHAPDLAPNWAPAGNELKLTIPSDVVRTRPARWSLASALAAWRNPDGSRIDEVVGTSREPILPGAFSAPRHAGQGHAEPRYPESVREPRRPRARPVPDDSRLGDDALDAGDAYGADEAEIETETVDPALEMSSRAIAERFAPPNARPAPHTQTLPADALPDDDLPRFVRAAAAAASPAAPASGLPASEPVRRPATSLLRAIGARRTGGAFRRPAPAMLKRSPPSKAGSEFSQTVLRGTARLLEDVLADFGVKGEVRDIKPGPVVTLYELEPARGTKATRIMALADDIARSMSATSARVAVVPGRNVIGIELPNSRRDTVGLRELIESPGFASAEGALPLALGRSIGGEPVVADLARMPHLLVAGTTGSGKSVGVNAMILSILFRHTPEECRFLMIDPKMLELSVYNGIPHLLSPVVTDPQKAVAALNWAVGEMEERYKRMARLSVRNIEAFNARVKGAAERGEQLARTVQTGFDAATGQPIYEREEMSHEPMPYIVVVVDEFADLMITAGKDIETAVQRLAQKARAAGIHLIMATQRPSVDIITGTIKANFPSRISFKVASKIDSRTILNEQGAEQLLGQGDMLLTSGAGQMLRVHGPFVSDEEVEAIAAHLRAQGAPRYVDAVTAPQDGAGPSAGPNGGEENESLYDRAVAVVLRDRKASTSYVQRRLSIGYNRAADLIERMEQEGLISAPGHTGRREILAGDPQGRSVA